jgi:hypothetical protein
VQQTSVRCTPTGAIRTVFERFAEFGSARRVIAVKPSMSVNKKVSVPVGIARREHTPVGGHDADAEVVRRGLAELGNVRRDGAFRVAAMTLVQFFDGGLELVFVHTGARSE